MLATQRAKERFGVPMYLPAFPGNLDVSRVHMADGVGPPAVDDLLGATRQWTLDHDIKVCWRMRSGAGDPANVARDAFFCGPMSVERGP